MCIASVCYTVVGASTELPLAFTSLELAMPVYITSMVVHYLVYHAVEHLEETGPFHVTNMLDMERFQSVLKTCAKGKTNVMQSIVNNFQLLRSAMNNRLVSPVDWVVTPCTSSTAAYLKEAASMKRTDRWHSVKGQCRSRTLGRKEFDWYTNHGTCAISGNPLVGPPEDRSRDLKKDRSQCYC